MKEFACFSFDSRTAEHYESSVGITRLVPWCCTRFIDFTAALNSLTSHAWLQQCPQTNNFVYKSSLTPSHERLFTAQIFATKEVLEMRWALSFRLSSRRLTRRSVPWTIRDIWWLCSVRAACSAVVKWDAILLYRFLVHWFNTNNTNSLEWGVNEARSWFTHLW